MRSTFWRNKNHLFLAAVDDGGSSKRRKRTKRKSPSQQSSGLEGEISEELLPNSDEEVEMEIKDIRQVVGGVSTIGFVSDAKEEEKTVGRNVLAVDKEVISVGSDTKLDSLEQLLADARRMREATGETEEKDDEISIPNILRNVIQTIVTVDFFFVCVLLLWFLAGIFCSYVLKSDDVQIAFNGKHTQSFKTSFAVYSHVSVRHIQSRGTAGFGNPDDWLCSRGYV